MAALHNKEAEKAPLETNLANANKPSENKVKELLRVIIREGFVEIPKRADPTYNSSKKALKFIKQSLAEDGHTPFWFRLNLNRSSKAVYNSTDLLGDHSNRMFFVADGERFEAYKNEVLATSMAERFYRLNRTPSKGMKQAMSQLLHEFNMHVMGLCGHNWVELRKEQNTEFNYEKS